MKQLLLTDDQFDTLISLFDFACDPDSDIDGYDFDFEDLRILQKTITQAAEKFFLCSLN